MGYHHVKQAQERLLASVANGSVDTTLAVANRTAAYREANLTDNQIELQDWTNGAIVSLKGTSDGDTGTFELWGYSYKGDAELIGRWTYVTDAQGPATGGGFWVDAFTESGTQPGQTVTEVANPDSKAVLKFDTLGFKHIVGLVTTVSAGTANLYLRPW